MQVGTTGNVLLAVAYGVGYALCDRDSAVHWSWRACMTAVSVVLYVMSAHWDDGALLVLGVTILADLCDSHRDALGLTKCIIGTAVVGLMAGNPVVGVVDCGGWAPTLAATVLALVVPRRARGLPSVDALALVLAAVVPVDPAPHEACARVLGLWLVLYFNGDGPHRMALHKVVHLVVAPWPAACLVAMAQIGRVTQGLTPGGTGSGPGLAPTVLV